MMASTSYNQTTYSSVSTSPPTLWDVFLSFRGKDTRYTFTDHLYKALSRTGIRTFKDDPELRRGEIISDSLIHAIQDSKAYIVVFSENYAFSSWCLDELVEILSCYKRMKRIIVPVFYNIEPSVVRHQLGSFLEAFEKHETCFEMEKVNKWRLTLTEVADFSGYHIFENRSEADLIDEVVCRVLLEINPTTLDVTKYPIGLDSRVKGVTALFNSDTEDVIRIGIHGMGGVGKTTLAKAVYNKNYQRFQGSSFLSNVREVSRTKGLACLQQQLINDVLKRNDVKINSVDQGIELIRARICSTKVLVVIDDLDDPKPLKYLEGSFALGSIVIITTRNEDLLDGMKVKAKYKVNQMDEDESRQLFIQHAFGEDKISKIYTELSREILEHAGGLPLALQVFGSTLRNESEDGWRWFLDKMKRAPIEDVEENLMISFDALKVIDLNLQDIFLDIACFYIGWTKEEVAEILETCYTFVNRKIGILEKRCLITVGSFGWLGMHDLLRDMGRKIARNNSPDDPGKYSRLWEPSDIYDVLKQDKGTEAIKGIKGILPKYLNWSVEDAHEAFAAETFKRMSKLRILYLENVNITGSFEQTFEDLRLLYWSNCPLKCLPSGFYPKNLVKLELPGSQMKTMWELNMVSKVFENLKVLNMSNSPNLTTTPDFTSFPCLETLDLECCQSLEEVHISIGSLIRLVSLNLMDCSNLKSLPDSICRLRALEALTIDGCSSLKALPTEMGNIASLKVLNAEGLILFEVPDSIGHLSKLVELRLGGNKNLATLPNSICKLRSLEILDIHGCEKLEELPDQLGMITSLRVLDASRNDLLKMLPDMGQLSNLKDLNFTGCFHMMSIAKLPPGLRGMQVRDFISLKTLPNLSNLKQLKILDLANCSALTEIIGLEELTFLTEVILRNCDYLLSISELPPNLIELKAEGCPIKRLPNLSNLKQLEWLDLRDCNSLTEIQGLEELTSLQGLDIRHCGDLLSISELPSNLKYIDAVGCTSVEILPNLCNLKLMKRLVLSDCTSLKRLPNLSNLKRLEKLDLTNCSGLIEIQGLEELTALQVLYLTGCNSSLLAYTLTNRFFQILFRFEHKIAIYIQQEEFPDWISRSTRNLRRSRMSLDLQPNVFHNFLGMILCFNTNYDGFYYSVNNIASGFTWRDNFYHYSGGYESVVIIPTSILSVRDSDNRIEITSDKEILHGIHLMYKADITMMGEYGSTIVNVEDGDLKNNKNWLSLGSPTANEDEEIRYPSKRLKRSECDNWLSL